MVARDAEIEGLIVPLGTTEAVGGVKHAEAQEHLLCLGIYVVEVSAEVLRGYAGKPPPEWHVSGGMAV